MKHARADYDGIQDSTGKIPEDEPVFLIRSKDMVGPAAVEAWANLAAAAGASLSIVSHAKIHSARMRDWQLTHDFGVPDL